MFRGDDGRTSRARATGLRRFNELGWQRSIVTGAGSVLEHKGMLFVTSSTRPGDRATVLAIDAASGSIVWSFLARGRIATPFALDRNQLWFGSDDGLYALDIGSCAERALVRTESAVWSSPLISRDTIYFATTSGEMRAIDARTHES